MREGEQSFYSEGETREPEQALKNDKTIQEWINDWIEERRQKEGGKFIVNFGFTQEELDRKPADLKEVKEIFEERIKKIDEATQSGEPNFLWQIIPFIEQKVGGQGGEYRSESTESSSKLGSLEDIQGKYVEIFNKFKDKGILIEEKDSPTGWRFLKPETMSEKEFKDAIIEALDTYLEYLNYIKNNHPGKAKEILEKLKDPRLEIDQAIEDWQKQKEKITASSRKNLEALGIVIVAPGVMPEVDKESSEIVSEAPLSKSAATKEGEKKDEQQGEEELADGKVKEIRERFKGEGKRLEIRIEEISEIVSKYVEEGRIILYSRGEEARAREIELYSNFILKIIEKSESRMFLLDREAAIDAIVMGVNAKIDQIVNQRAEDALRGKQKELKWWQVIKKMKYHTAEAAYRMRMRHTLRDAIIENGNLFIEGEFDKKGNFKVADSEHNKDGSDQELQSMIGTYLLTGEALERGNLINDERLDSLVFEYVNGRISGEEYKSRLEELIEERKSIWDERLKGEEIAHNLNPEQLEALRNHIVSMEMMDINTLLDLKVNVETLRGQPGLYTNEVNLNRLDKAVVWVQKNKILNKFLNPTAVAWIGVGLGFTARSLFSKTGSMILPVVGLATGTLGAIGYGAARRNMELKYDRWLGTMKKACGVEPGPEDKRLARIMGQTYEMKAYNELIDQLRSGDPEQIKQAVIETKARLMAGRERKVDLISYHSMETIESDKLSLVQALATAERALRDNGIEVDENEITNRKEELIREALEKDSEFTQFKRKEVLKSAAIAGAIAGACSAVSFYGTRWIHEKILGTKGPKGEKVSRLIEDGKSGRTTMTETIQVKRQPDGLYEFVDARGNKVSGVKIENGIPNFEGKQLPPGWKIESRGVIVNQSGQEVYRGPIYDVRTGRLTEEAQRYFNTHGIQRNPDGTFVQDALGGKFERMNGAEVDRIRVWHGYPNKKHPTGRITGIHGEQLYGTQHVNNELRLYSGANRDGTAYLDMGRMINDPEDPFRHLSGIKEIPGARYTSQFNTNVEPLNFPGRFDPQRHGFLISMRDHDPNPVWIPADTNGHMDISDPILKDIIVNKKFKYIEACYRHPSEGLRVLATEVGDGTGSIPPPESLNWIQDTLISAPGKRPTGIPIPIVPFPRKPLEEGRGKEGPSPYKPGMVIVPPEIREIAIEYWQEREKVITVKEETYKKITEIMKRLDQRRRDLKEAKENISKIVKKTILGFLLSKCEWILNTKEGTIQIKRPTTGDLVTFRITPEEGKEAKEEVGRPEEFRDWEEAIWNEDLRQQQEEESRRKKPHYKFTIDSIVKLFQRTDKEARDLLQTPEALQFYENNRKIIEKKLAEVRRKRERTKK